MRFSSSLLPLVEIRAVSGAGKGIVVEAERLELSVGGAKFVPKWDVISGIILE